MLVVEHPSSSASGGRIALRCVPHSCPKAQTQNQPLPTAVLCFLAHPAVASSPFSLSSPCLYMYFPESPPKLTACTVILKVHFWGIKTKTMGKRNKEVQELKALVSVISLPTTKFSLGKAGTKVKRRWGE